MNRVRIYRDVVVFLTAFVALILHLVPSRQPIPSQDYSADRSALGVLGCHEISIDGSSHPERARFQLVVKYGPNNEVEQTSFVINKSPKSMDVVIVFGPTTMGDDVAHADELFVNVQSGWLTIRHKVANPFRGQSVNVVNKCFSNGDIALATDPDSVLAEGLSDVKRGLLLKSIP